MVKKRITKKVAKIVKDYTQRLSREDKLPIKRVIIFGSQVNGRKKKWSDIDVCIVSPKFKDSFQALEYLWSRRKDEEVRQGLEPIGFSPKEFKQEDSLIQEIKRKGIRLRF